MKVYVASSWRNPRQIDVVAMFRQAGHEVYDYRHPNVEGPGAAPDAGFGWEEIGGGWQTWTPRQFIEALEHPIAEEGFSADWSAMQWADAFVLVMPCGRSAHLEAGWAIGAGKPTAVSFEPGEPFEAELMYKMADLITDDSQVILAWLTEQALRHQAGASGSPGWTKREPNDGGFATNKQSRGRIGGVRRER